MVQNKKSNTNKKIYRNAQRTKTYKKHTSNKNVHILPNTHTRDIVKIFIEMLNMVKLYHWKTRSYAQHKATDDLYTKLNEHIDTFIEVLLGKTESRIKSIENNLTLLNINNVEDFKERVYEYREFLIDMNIYLDSKKDTDLLNIRDELLGDINQFLYLLTFDK